MNYKQKVLLAGGVVGALLGTVAGWIYYNNHVRVDREGSENLKLPSTGDAVKVGVAVLGLLRLLAE